MSGYQDGIILDLAALAVRIIARMNLDRKGIVKLHFIVGILLLTGYSQATTLTVCPDGCDYASVQLALDAANDGDAIEVYSESYPSSGNILQNVRLDSIKLDNESYFIFKNVWIGGVRINTVFGRFKGANNSFAKSEEPFSMAENKMTQIPMTAEGSGVQTKAIGASEIIAKIQKNESLEYDNYTIVGYLSLPNKISMHAHFNDTIFEGPVNFDSVIFNNNAFFRGANFNGDARFDSSSFNMTADFSGAKFNGDASFVHSNFNGTADFRDAMFNQNDGSWDSQFWFSRFNGDALFAKSSFNGIADFWNSEFNRKADFSNTKFNYAKFHDSKFGGDTLFTQSSFNRTADFENAIYKKDVFFGDSKFNGTAIFINSNFNGTVDFKDSTFNGAITFRNSLFNKGAFFGGSVFNGDAIFIDSNFNDDAEFFDTKFNWHAYFICDFNGMALFRSQFNKDAKFGIWEGEAIISKADPFFFKKFNGIAQFSGSNFNGNAYFRGLQFNKKADFEWCKFNNNADFNMSEFNGNTYFRNAKFFGILNFTKVKYNHLEIYWSDIKHLECNDGPTYLELIKYFRDTEQYGASDDVYFQYRDWRQNQRPWSDSYKYLDGLAMFICGYGVKPLNTIILAVSLFLFFALIYYGLVFEMKFFEASWLSALALLSLPKELASLGDKFEGFIGTKTRGLNLIRYFYIFERLIGWALLVVFITTLSRIMIRY